MWRFHTQWCSGLALVKFRQQGSREKIDYVKHKRISKKSAGTMFCKHGLCGETRSFARSGITYSCIGCEGRAPSMSHFEMISHLRVCYCTCCRAWTTTKLWVAHDSMMRSRHPSYYCFDTSGYPGLALSCHTPPTYARLERVIVVPHLSIACSIPLQQVATRILLLSGSLGCRLGIYDKKKVPRINFRGCIADVDMLIILC